MTSWLESPQTCREHIVTEVLRDEVATAATLSLLDEALLRFPTSAALWCLRGDLMQLASEDALPVEEIVESYLKAAELEPDSPEPLESLGNLYDAVLDDPAAAVPYFRKAIALGAGRSAHEGLAAVLEQLESVDSDE